VVGASLATSAGAAPDRTTRTLTSAASAKSVAGVWTASNMKAAKMYTDGGDASGRFKVSKKASADGGAGLIAPTGSNRSVGASKNVNLPTSVGRVFFRVDGDLYYCSASAVQSKYRNLVATAGHCVYDTDKNKPVDSFVFVPGYYQGKAPWGIYVGAKVHTHFDFDVYEDYDRDYAFVNVFDGIKYLGGKKWASSGRLGDNVGGQGFAWNQPVGKNVFAFGYPTGAHPDGDRPYSGETMKHCYGQTGHAPAIPTYKVEEQIAIKCAFTGGASGGPWLLQYSNSKRAGYLNGVSSIAIDSDDNQRYDRLASPFFDSETAAIYKYAANLWTGKLR
jgi:V8-like Glu-specific endopeptidase